MLRFMLGPARRNRLRYQQAFDEFEGPKVFLSDRAALETFYRRNGLARRSR
jgi:DNA phosphorothioation-dependent restriction protein DptG